MKLLAVFLAVLAAVAATHALDEEAAALPLEPPSGALLGAANSLSLYSNEMASVAYKLAMSADVGMDTVFCIRQG